MLVDVQRVNVVEVEAVDLWRLEKMESVVEALERANLFLEDCAKCVPEGDSGATK